MCIPKPPTPAIAPTQIPSMESASALNLGIPRGAAGLGRLALRNPAGASSAAASSTTTTTTAPAVAPNTSAPGAAQAAPPWQNATRFNPSFLYLNGGGGSSGSAL